MRTSNGRCGWVSEQKARYVGRCYRTRDALPIQTYPGATVLLQPTLLLNMHAKDRGTDQIAANQTKGGVDPAQIVNLGIIAGLAECEARAPERKAAAAGAEGLFGFGMYRDD